MTARTAAFVLTLALLTLAIPAQAVLVYDADFNAQPLGPLTTQSNGDPLPLHLPTGIIRDSGCTADVVASAGDLTNKPVLLNAVPHGLSSVGFFNPVQFTVGDYQVSWDSLVMTMPIDPRPDQGQVAIAANNGGSLESIWRLKYDTDGTFLIADATGSHTVSGFTPAVSDHFDLYLDLTNGSYQLDINNTNELAGLLIAPGTFNHTIFHSNGRGTELSLAPFAFDNLEVIPEPATLALLALSTLVLIKRRR